MRGTKARTKGRMGMGRRERMRIGKEMGTRKVVGEVRIGTEVKWRG